MKLPRLFKLDRYELVGVSVAIGVVGPIAWMAMDQTPPLEIVSVAAPAAPVPRLGALRLDYRARYIRSNCSGEGQRKFVDVARTPTWTEPYAFRTGIGFDGKPIALGRVVALPPVSVTVPKDLAPGPTTYENDVRFYCNPLQKLFGPRWPFLSIAAHPTVVHFLVSDAIATHPVPSTHIFEPAISSEPDQEIARP